MALSFAEIPTVDNRVARTRTRPPAASRRVVLGTAFGVATAAAFGVLDAVNKGVARAAWNYSEWIGVTTGPCAPGQYASGHSEAGIPCGPSTRCRTAGCCQPAGGQWAGWHKNEGVFTHRPDECWTRSYEAWRWNFGAGGRTWRCSDGFWRQSSGTIRSICDHGF